MAEVLEFFTEYVDINGLLDFLAERVDDEGIMLTAAHAIPDGEYVRFCVRLADGEVGFEGVGKCMGSSENESGVGFEALLEQLQFDARNEVMFERIQLARETLETGEGTKPIDISDLAAQRDREKAQERAREQAAVRRASQAPGAPSSPPPVGVTVPPPPSVPPKLASMPPRIATAVVTEKQKPKMLDVNTELNPIDPQDTSETNLASIDDVESLDPSRVDIPLPTQSVRPPLPVSNPPVPVQSSAPPLPANSPAPAIPKRSSAPPLPKRSSAPPLPAKSAATLPTSLESSVSVAPTLAGGISAPAPVVAKAPVSTPPQRNKIPYDVRQRLEKIVPTLRRRSIAFDEDEALALALRLGLATLEEMYSR